MKKSYDVPGNLCRGKGTGKQQLEKEITGLKLLDQQEFESFKRRNPNTPEHARVRVRYKDNNANNLGKALIRLCQLSGHQAERISVTGRVLDTRQIVTDGIGRQKVIGNVRRIKASMQKGSADISATIFGRSVKIEIKIGKDQQSEAQKIYQSQIEAAGGIYLIVKDFQSFYDWFINFREEVESAKQRPRS